MAIRVKVSGAPLMRRAIERAASDIAHVFRRSLEDAARGIGSMRPVLLRNPGRDLGFMRVPFDCGIVEWGGSKFVFHKFEHQKGRLVEVWKTTLTYGTNRELTDKP